ncbi:hypothetical protein AB0395_33000 [Streptosporangium sp. NPDC051023]|uniref:hypothetical protein n=1 Tax=Streptosporangium sp. NPDC051023 TaxID=3155410 RepID=UPI00344D9CCC
MNGGTRGRLLLFLAGLYPRWWRRRYGEEFTDLVTELADDRGQRTFPLALDLVAGLIDAYLVRRHVMTVFSADGALRRGAGDGLLVGGLVAIVAFLTNVLFPGGPDDSDGDLGNEILILGMYLLIGILLAVIGGRGRRRANTRNAGAKSGAVAGLVIGVTITVTFLAIDNLFFGLVSQQHDKVVAFASSGWSSMRSYMNVSLLTGAAVLLPVLTVVGGVLGFLGGRVASRGRELSV